MTVQYTIFKVREMDHQVHLGRNFHDWDRLSHLRRFSASSGQTFHPLIYAILTSRDESVGTHAPDPSSSQDSVAPVSLPRTSSPDDRENASPNPTHHEPRHDPHDVSSQRDPDVSSEAASTDDAECRESLESTPEAPTEACAAEESTTSRALTLHPTYSNPAPGPVGHIGSVLPRSTPYLVSLPQPAMKTNWSVAPMNKPIGESSYRLSHSRYSSEESGSDTYSQYGDYDTAVWQPPFEEMSRDSRSRGYRTRSTSTHGSSRSRGNRRDGRRDGRAYADSYDSDDSREGHERRRRRKRVSDQVAHYAAAFVVGALLVARAAR